jgi:TRAP-type C4-dicarboxylate transport system permease small subunit
MPNTRVAPAVPDVVPSGVRDRVGLSRRFVSLVAFLSTAFAVVSAVLFAAAMFVICHMILTRYVFRAPTIWHTDFAVYSATAAVFLGAPYVLLKRGHVGVDVVEAVVGPQTRRVLRTAGRAFGLLFCFAMLIASALFAHEAWDNEWHTSGVWQIPLWIPTLPLPVGFALLCLQYVAEFFQDDARSAG